MHALYGEAATQMPLKHHLPMLLNIASSFLDVSVECGSRQLHESLSWTLGALLCLLPSLCSKESWAQFPDVA